MAIRLSITFDSYITLRNILDDCRVLRITRHDYSRLMDITLELERQATRRTRVADIVSLELDALDYVCIRECIFAVEHFGCSTRSSEEVRTLVTELDWSCELADALIGD